MRETQAKKCAYGGDRRGRTYHPRDQRGGDPAGDRGRQRPRSLSAIRERAITSRGRAARTSEVEDHWKRGILLRRAWRRSFDRGRRERRMGAWLESMMSGLVRVHSHAGSGAAAAAPRGRGRDSWRARRRAWESRMKGGDVIVAGDCGYMAGFMAQKGTLIVCGDAGEAFADSMYATVCYVGGDLCFGHRRGTGGDGRRRESATGSDIGNLPRC